MTDMYMDVSQLPLPSHLQYVSIYLFYFLPICLFCSFILKAAIICHYIVLCQILLNTNGKINISM